MRLPEPRYRLRTLAAAIAALTLLASAPGARAGAAIGATAMRAAHANLAPQLANSPLGAPLVLKSQEAGRRVEGDIYAVLDHPFGLLSLALSDPAAWCDVLVLHLNTKHCRRGGSGEATHILLRVGKKEEQPVTSAALLDFAWRSPVVRADYFAAGMTSSDGPYDTRDYELLVEAVPLDVTHTFVHMGYSLSYGGASGLALKLYLATVARDKVGFTQLPPARPGERAEFVQGMRGVTERNTLRYYLAMDAYLASLTVAPAQRLERRLAMWFDATERYPRQLHEIDRDAYLRMKRNEAERQRAPTAPP